ncbi:transposase [uncultured Microbulbifer sp.]|uniref:transposase n=1 Tax=uncultured Microbulbifer sp. TaxID=348147 RepID=UPI00344DD4DC
MRFKTQSGHQLIERLHYDPMFNWFVGLDMEYKVWIPNVFTKNWNQEITGYVDNHFQSYQFSQPKA